MNRRLQFGLLFAAMSFSLAAGVAFGQSAHPERPPQRQQSPPKSNAGGNRPPAQNPNANRAPKQNPTQNQTGNADRPPTRQTQPQADRNSQRNGSRPPGNRPPSATIGPSRPENFAPNNLNNRPNGFDRSGGGSPDGPNAGARLTPRQQVGAGSARPAFVDRMREFTPQQRERVLQGSKTFQNLAPDQQNRIRQQFNQWDRMSSQQRADLREKENTWRNLTPEQRQYIKGDVMPRWRQMPWQRQQVIQQKLGVLQNMPESARNRRLSDPNFTRGMSDEDRAMLHDLSHLHVGGAPDPPGNEP
jgi:hypothetical protein